MDKEFWMTKFFELVRLLLGNIWNRTGSLIALAGVGVLTGWMDKLVMAYTRLKWEETEQWVGWLLLAVGLCMLIYGGWKTRTPNPHDLELIKKFRSLFGLSDIDFLTNHNFHDNWHVTRTSSLEDVADSWIGAQYEFVDKHLNKLLSHVKQRCTEFANAEAYGFNLGPNHEIRTMKTDPDRYQGLSQQTRNKIANLNSLARDLAEAINDLEKAAKIRLPGA